MGASGQSLNTTWLYIRVLSGRSQELSTAKNPNALTLGKIGIWRRARLDDVDAEPVYVQRVCLAYAWNARYTFTFERPLRC
jgi:hypothetical protein